MLFGKSIDEHLNSIICQGNYDKFKQFIWELVQRHRKEYTEENLPTAEDAILEAVNEALDKMWEIEGCVRSMGVYKSFIPIREAIKNDDDERKTAIEYAEYERLKKKFETLT